MPPNSNVIFASSPGNTGPGQPNLIFPGAGNGNGNFGGLTSHNNHIPGPQTIVYEQKDNDRPPPPPQPILKYHLIRHSYPAKGDENYFADVPAYLQPGPPYLPQALPSK